MKDKEKDIAIVYVTQKEYIEGYLITQSKENQDGSLTSLAVNRFPDKDSFRKFAEAALAEDWDKVKEDTIFCMELFEGGEAFEKFKKKYKNSVS